jgi:hypothetical protein
MSSLLHQWLWFAGSGSGFRKRFPAAGFPAAGEIPEKGKPFYDALIGAVAAGQVTGRFGF